MSTGTDCWVYNAAFSVVFAHAAGSFVIASKGPCTTPDQWCDSFTSEKAPRKLPLTAVAPRKGSSEITFHGSSVCLNSNTTTDGVFLTTQIVTGSQNFPSGDGPGGLSHLQRLEAAGSQAVADTFDFTSTRILQFSGAANTAASFLIYANMVPKQRCLLYNASFASLFIPS
jgi:hypothetical protein